MPYTEMLVVAKPFLCMWPHEHREGQAGLLCRAAKGAKSIVNALRKSERCFVLYFRLHAAPKGRTLNGLIFLPFLLDQVTCCNGRDSI